MGEGANPTANKLPKIYAHRGASQDFPEHTREAYEGAIVQGADGFECDVRLTKDGVAVLWHDADMSRITNSKYLGTIADLTFDEIRLHYSKVMKLTDLIEFAIKHRKDLALETKHPVPTGHEVEREIARILNSYASELISSEIEVSLMSFSWFAVEFFTRLNVDIPVTTVMLLNRSTAPLFRRFTSAQSFGPGFNLFKDSISSFESSQNHGRKLFVWTVDQPEEMKMCLASGIDVLITNKPELARKVLGYP